MATTTTAKLGLVKPDYNEAADVAVINTNMDKIDEAVGDLNEANILPMAETTIPANSNFNTYYTPGVYRVASDAIGQTIQNSPYLASGKLIVIARTTSATNGYTMQVWIPSASAQKIFVRNYNAGSFSDWEELTFFETGTWVPHLYDFNTKVMEGSAQPYYKIGVVCFAPYSIVLPADLTLETMLQIKNLPFTYCWHGSFWSTSWAGGAGVPVRMVQPASGAAYFRPNITGTFESGKTFAGILIGV